MKQIIITITLLILSIGIYAQSLTDKELERIASGALAEEISHCPENGIRYAGVVVMEVARGNVKANVSIFYKNGEFIKNSYGNTKSVPTGLGRSVLYLAMMPEANMVVDTKDGLYVDSDGYTIEDHNHKRGGYGVIDLKRGFAVNSDICLLRCAEQVFKKNMKTFAKAINKTGVSFGAKVSEDFDQRWSSRDILGYTSPFSLLQMACWLNAVAGGKFVIRMDEKDSTIPYDSIFSSQEAIDSLRSAMKECVTDGLGRKMNSEYVSVAGLTNNSPKSVDGYKGQFAACFLPYEEPKYTVTCYIWRKWDKGYANPSNVVRKVIDWIAFNRLDKHPYLSSSDSQSIKHRDGWLHPAAR